MRIFAITGFVLSIGFNIALYCALLDFDELGYAMFCTLIIPIDMVLFAISKYIFK